MKKGLFLWVTVFMLILFSMACKQKIEVKGGGESVLARINDKEITLSEFNEMLKEYPSLAHGAQGDTIDLETQKGFLDNLIVREILYQQAIRSGIDKEKETASLLEEMKKRIVVDKFFKKEVDDTVSVTENDVKKFYEEHPEEAKNPDEIRASHILLKTHEDAESVKKKLREGLIFEDIAKKFSVDSGSREKGGDLGFFHKGVMVPEFDEAAFKLKVGGVSDIVKTQFGFHIIKVLEKREGRKKGFDEAKTELERMILKNKRKERFDTLVAELKSKAKITINEDILKGTKGENK